MTQTAYATDSNPFSATLSNLTPGTTYYYKAFATVYGTGDYASQSQTFYSATMSFSTPEANGEPALSGKTGWLELPAEADNNSSYFVDWFSSGEVRLPSFFLLRAFNNFSSDQRPISTSRPALRRVDIFRFMSKLYNFSRKRVNQTATQSRFERIG